MDTSDYPSLGRLAKINAQISAQIVRVAATVDNQLDYRERLFRAVADDDWPAVVHLSEQLASLGAEPADKSLIAAAQNVCVALRRDPSGVQAKQSLSELLAACREAKHGRLC